MAESIQRGAASVSGVESDLLPIEASDIQQGRYRNDSLFDRLAGASAIVFGSPTYMGSASAQMKAFMDASSELWLEQSWKDKYAGGFTCGASPSGDKLFTLQQFSIFASQHAMHWINSAELPTETGINRLGASLGIMAFNPSFDTPTALHPGDDLTAFLYGKRIAETVLRNAVARSHHKESSRRSETGSNHAEPVAEC